jgi:hypothetical protein
VTSIRRCGTDETVTGGEPAVMARQVVYFARLGDQSHDPIKIGTTAWLPARLKALEWYYGCKVEVLGVLRGGRQVELDLHERFAKHRFGRSEQFAPTEEILTFIGAHCRSWEDFPSRPGLGEWTITFTYRLDDLRWMERAAKHAGLSLREFFDEAIGYYSQRVGFDEPRPALQSAPLIKRQVTEDPVPMCG